MTTALERSDRYLLEFVEAFGLCPFARRCRESGRLHRRVVAAGEELLDHVRAVEALPEPVEVALLLCPEAQEDPQEWEAEVRRLREALGPAPRFHCVAFHPDFADEAPDAARAVRFLRKSPDPTVQLVDARLLQAVRAGREGGSRFVDPSRLDAADLLALATVGLSDAIGEENFATVRRVGVDRLRRLLASMRAK